MGQRIRNRKALAKTLFFQFKDTPDIAREARVSEPSVYNWAKEWADERDAETKRYVSERLSHSARNISKVVEISVPLIQQSIMHRFRQAFTKDGQPLRPLDVKEIKMLTEVVTALDKLLRLDQGKATDIVEAPQYMPVSLDELRAAVKNDYFIGAVKLEKGVTYEDITGRADGTDEGQSRGTSEGATSGGLGPRQDEGDPMLAGEGAGGSGADQGEAGEAGDGAPPSTPGGG